MKLYDISQPVSAAIAVWPGDQPYRLDWTLRLDRGASCNVAALTMSVHTGTHTDAGFHVLADGARVGDLPLDAYLGPAELVDAVGLDALDERVLDRFDVRAAQRVLFRTRVRVAASEFPREFLYPSPELARRLVDAGIKLVGTDAPSMDHQESKTLDTHKVLVTGGVAILENLALSAVPAGRYTLIALPLKLLEADGSPVRAVLVEGPIG